MIKNIISQFFVKKRSFVLLKKIINNFSPHSSSKKIITWLNKNSQDYKTYLKELDEKIFNETVTFVELMENENEKILSKINVKLGGGANQKLLFFLTRFLKPDIVLETGVAAGHSSKVILKALEKNKKGVLFSSDFPYFRIKNPEKYIGILLDEKLKKNWNLAIEGDEINLKGFFKTIKKVDLFHYDSDKSYKGKKKVFNLIIEKMSKGSKMIFDDIQDDTFFIDIVAEYDFNFKVFNFENKFIGLISDIKL
jgi:predicted O-methyltransferase YrrM